MTNTKEKLTALRADLLASGLDGFYLTRADMFQGEEVRPPDEFLCWLTGFSGSAGAALVLASKAAVFSDSRYTLQMHRQIDLSQFEAFDSAEMPLEHYMAAADYSAGSVKIGYDSWAVTVSGRGKLPKRLGAADVEWTALYTHPLASLWTDRPDYQTGPVFFLDDKTAGQPAAQKRAQAASQLADAGCDYQLISHVDCVNWLLNMRGRDLCHTPFLLSFALLDSTGNLLLITDCTDPQEQAVQTISWKELDVYLAGLSGKKIACDSTSLPVALEQLLISSGLEIHYWQEPLIAVKARKNPAEIAGFRDAHQRDGLALCRFWHWLETAAETDKLSESQLADRLSAFRAEDSQYLCDSFATIAGFRDHGAIVHYRAVPGDDRLLSGAGVLLLDSGAHYSCGTTDITRCFYLGGTGNVPDEIRAHASFVLAGHIELASAVFPETASAAQLDGICRAPLWSQGLDYGHGTGHGVGHILSVHEGPVSISKRCPLPLEAGMVLSNEPGHYKEGAYGIRHENLVLVVPRQSGFLGFETLSCFPFDLRLINSACLTDRQQRWLSAYHREIYERLQPHLDEQLSIWLREKCRPA